MGVLPEGKKSPLLGGAQGKRGEVLDLPDASQSPWCLRLMCTCIKHRKVATPLSQAEVVMYMVASALAGICNICSFWKHLE